MKNFFKLTAFALAACLMTNAHADNNAGVSLKLTDKSARIGVMSETKWMSENYVWDAGLQFDKDSNYILDTSLLYLNTGLIDPNLDLGVKGKILYANSDDLNLSSYGLMLGAFGRYWLPTSVPTAIVVEGLYGPEILTWGDGKNVTELMVRGQVRLLQNLTGFVGLRRFEVKYDKANNPTHKFENSAHIGIELTF